MDQSLGSLKIKFQEIVRIQQRNCMADNSSWSAQYHFIVWWKMVMWPREELQCRRELAEPLLLILVSKGHTDRRAWVFDKVNQWLKMQRETDGKNQICMKEKSSQPLCFQRPNALYDITKLSNHTAGLRKFESMRVQPSSHSELTLPSVQIYTNQSGCSRLECFLVRLLRVFSCL